MKMNTFTPTDNLVAAITIETERDVSVYADENSTPGAEDNGSLPNRSEDQKRDAFSELRTISSLRQIEEIPIADLEPNLKNARKHPENQIALLQSAIENFGFVVPIVIDEENIIISGHGRLEAAKRQGMQNLPCVRVTHLNGSQKVALALADNRIAELSIWDDDALAEALCGLTMDGIDFDIEITGFDTVDIDRMLGEQAAPVSDNVPVDDFSKDADDAVDEPDRKSRSISRMGDVWKLGDHVLIQADAGDRATYEALLGDEIVTQVVTDPPYNVPNAGHVSSKGFREFAEAHGEMSSSQFTKFLEAMLEQCSAFAADGAIFHVCMDWRHITELSSAASSVGLETKNVCIWAKPSPGQGSFYRSQHEFVFVLKHDDAKHINNFGLGARGRTRSNVWRYPAVRGLRTGVNDAETGHPTVKPVAMMADAIRDCSMRGDIVLDPFGGSGTTLIAAQRVGRRARLIEIDGHYVDLTIRRWQTSTGIAAVRVSDDARFDAVAAERQRDQPVREDA